MAPEGVAAQVLVTDGPGSDYLLPYPCTLRAEGWVNTASGKPLVVRPTYWKLYVETLPKRNLRNPAAEGGPEGGVFRPRTTLPEGQRGVS
jgi:hypothetical protein